jgi:hypothetical protein
MLNALKRIATSKKSLLVSIGLIGDAAAVWGFDVPVEAMTSGLMLWWNAGVGLLVAGQAAIDAVQGSPSDKAASSSS